MIYAELRLLREALRSTGCPAGPCEPSKDEHAGACPRAALERIEREARWLGQLWDLVNEVAADEVEDPRQRARDLLGEADGE